jgi:hypothetical protein
MATCLLAGQLAANLAHPPQISLTAGIAIWLADLALVLLMALHPFTARLSLPVASFFFPTPIFLHALPFSRFALMVPLFFAPVARHGPVLADRGRCEGRP